ncbi:MAG: amino acid carrier protein [Candidatus Babeliales bacterium]|jgi:AGCS family alanine or glycine:cation symporter
MINPLHALLTAMATTIGMGNIAGPSIAIAMGGPGALFWLVMYAFLGSVVKFTEVMFSISLRKKLPDGSVLGGPTQYLRDLAPWLGAWYGAITVFLFAGWSGLQANTLANVFYLEAVPKWATGLALAAVVFFALTGGIKRIGEIASKLVPCMFVLYVSFASFILFQNPSALYQAVCLVFNHAFQPCAAVGGFLGATVFMAMKTGIHRSIYITECGLGTSSIAHAMADTDEPRDQALLAMFSVGADTILSILSGLLVLVTGVWSRGEFTSTLVYEVFRDFSSDLGRWVLLLSITLFVLTTVIGNSFNASQSYAAFTRYRGMTRYYIFLSAIIFCGALVEMPLAWKVMDVLLILVAIPHLIGLVLLTLKHPKLIK